MTGKVKQIIRSATSSKNSLAFDYDAMGNRIAKYVYTDYNCSNLQKITYYVRDAQGNEMATYDYVVNNGGLGINTLTLMEQPIYGGSRLGMDINQADMLQTGSVVRAAGTLGNRKYELTNHLGNVLSVITDRKVTKLNSGFFHHYEAVIVSATDYYPFGMIMHGRSWGSGTGYRFGFNGQERDDEVEGEGNANSFKYRIDDTRLGRFFSIDPLTKKYPFYSPYQFAANSPVIAGDLEGLENPVDLNTVEQVLFGNNSADKRTNNHSSQSNQSQSTTQLNQPKSGNIGRQVWGTMAICTNVDENALMLAGHAWIDFKRSDGTEITYSLYGNQGDNEFFQDMELSYAPYATRSATVTYDDMNKFLIYISNPSNDDWTCTNTCAGFSTGAWHAVTGENLNATNIFGWTIPAILAGSIINANGDKRSNTSATTENTNSSTSSSANSSNSNSSSNRSSSNSGSSNSSSSSGCSGGNSSSLGSLVTPCVGPKATPTKKGTQTQTTPHH